MSAALRGGPEQINFETLHSAWLAKIKLTRHILCLALRAAPFWRYLVPFSCGTIAYASLARTALALPSVMAFSL
jgi:hypothetical protein